MGGYNRVIKDNGAIALFAQTPFDKILGCSNLKMLKYEWIWEKSMATGFLNCNFAPMKAHENIMIFSKNSACYVKDKSKAMKYNPQTTEGKPYKSISGRNSTNYGRQKQQLNINNGIRYPRDIQKFSHDKERLHPTQKPVALLEYLIKTYTNENDLVLDNCAGSMSTAIACLNTNRDCIMIEKDNEYFKIGRNRVENHIKENNLNTNMSII